MGLQRYHTFWIIGASDGIGKELALALASKGKDLILSSRNKTALQEVQTQCNRAFQTTQDTQVRKREEQPSSTKQTQLSSTPQVHLANALHAEPRISIQVFDCNDIAQCKSISKTIANTVDVVIFSAGLSQRALTFDMKKESNAQVYAVNFLAPVEIARELLLVWKEAGKNGQMHADIRANGSVVRTLPPKKIVVISSVAGHLPVPLRGMYGASKCALEHYCKTLHNELIQQRISNIDIVSIVPGYVQTNISKKAILGNLDPWGQMDKNQAKGLKVEIAARQILKAISAKRRHFTKYIGLKFEVCVILIMYKIMPKLANLLLQQANTAKKHS